MGQGLEQVHDYIKREFAKMRGGWEPPKNLPAITEPQAYEPHAFDPQACDPNLRDAEPHRSMLEAEEVIEFEVVQVEEPEVYTTQQRIEHERQARSLCLEAVEQVSLLPTEKQNDVHHIVPPENVKLEKLYRQCLKAVMVPPNPQPKKESWMNKRIF